MTERERMISGKLYNPYMISDNPWAEIRAACKKFNESDFWSDKSALDELKKHFAEAGEDMVLTPPFYCDHGDKIYFGKHFYANTGLTILDENAVIFGDEGISATDTRHRDGFNKMVQDALDGKIDLIVTKSVSRFARNTVDSLTTVRKLKEKGVEVYFQKENIYTPDSKGEFLITIMSSLVQEEFRSISENVTWGKRKGFADGKVSLAYSSFLGCRKGEDGQMEVVQEEAETVRLIYRLFMQGQTPYAIAKYLTDKNIPTPTGKETWRHRTVENILSNEKYKGDTRLQKCYTVDFLSKKRKANEGEVPQYYVE